jgi:hypothetical protein
MMMGEAEALGLIQGAGKTKKIYADAASLKAGGEELRAFMLAATRSVGGMPPDLVAYFELVSSLTRITDRFPRDAEYRVRTGDGVAVLDGAGRLVAVEGADAPDRAAQEAEDEALSSLISSSRREGAAVLDGLDSVEPRPLSELFKAYAMGRINHLCVAAFAGAPSRMDEEWQLPRLRTFYALEGSPSWIPPIDDFAKIDAALGRSRDAPAFRAQILKAMADAGRTGFCPTQYLRHVIAPLLKRRRGALDAFKAESSLLADSFVSVCARMGPEGDGSASNLFTLKTLLRPLADPRSRLFSGARDPASPRPDEVLAAICERWARLFREGRPFTRELLRTYGQLYLAGIARIETPRAILAESVRLLDHVAAVSARVADASDYRRFRKPLHAKGVAVLIARAERSERRGPLLRLIRAHFETVERMLEAEASGAKPFASPAYLRYLRFFAAGSFHDPRDIEAFFSMLRNLGRDDEDSDEIVAAVLSTASEPEERERLLSFLRECPVFDPRIYEAWKAQDGPSKAALVGRLGELLQEYLRDGRVSTSLREYGLDALVVEAALIRELVRSSQLDRVKIDGYLSISSSASGDAVPKELQRPARFAVRERGAGERPSGASPRRDFLAAKARLAHECFESSCDEGRLQSLARSLAARAVEYGEGLGRAIRAAERQLAEAEGAEGELRASIERKIAGLVEQAAPSRHFAAAWQRLSGAEKAVTELAIALLIGLLGDKGFAKREAEAYMELLIALALDGEGIGRLASSPFREAADACPGEGDLRFEEVSALKELFSTTARQTISAWIGPGLARLAPASQAAVRALYGRCLGKAAAENDAVAADLAFRRYSAAASLQSFDAELASLSRAEKGGTRNVLLVGAKRRMDQFYGYVGELCIAQHVQELKRRDFFPIRIVDETRSRLVGYVHLFIAHYSEGGEQRKAAVLGGIEPKSSWLAYIDEIDFYVKLKDAMIDYAEALGAGLLAMTSNPVAVSNCAGLARIAALDQRGKPLFEGDKPLSFPQGYWNLYPASVLWRAD